LFFEKMGNSGLKESEPLTRTLEFMGMSLQYRKRD
jgi:hypothetical protein